MKEKILDWMSWLGIEPNTGFAFTMVIFVSVFAILIVGILIRICIERLLTRAHKTKTLWDDALIMSFRGPLRFLIWSVGLSYVAELAWDSTNVSLGVLIANIRTLAVIVAVAWFAVRFLNNAEKVILDSNYEKVTFDRVGVRAVNKVLKISAVITAALVALNTLGYSITGVLAFGGIGGIAIGFAARDLLANFFGGLMIYLDRPFTEGERIRSPDESIIGVVEDIGWRLTKLRTPDMRLLYVPNSKFASMSIENISRMTHRRFRETVGVRYDDANKVPKIAQQIEDMFLAEDAIDNNMSVVVNLKKFSDSSVDIFVNAYTLTTDWVQFHQIKQDLMMGINRIVEENGAEIAFPTTEVHLSKS